MSNYPNVRAGRGLTYDDIGQFVMLPHTFIHDAKKKKLRFHARWLFVALLYFRNGRTGNAFPSYDTLHDLTGLHRNMISECMKELEDAGWISRKRRYNATTLYTVNFPATNGGDSNQSNGVNSSTSYIRYYDEDGEEIPF